MTIDPLGEVPVYLQLAAILRDRIKAGDLAVGRPLPSLQTLMQQYEISRGTASRATALLITEGLARSVPGKGIYVIAKRAPK